MTCDYSECLSYSRSRNHMPNNPYKDLPLESLYELMVSAVKELLEALESNEDGGIATKAKKKQCEMLYNSIITKVEIDKKSVTL